MLHSVHLNTQADERSDLPETSTEGEFAGHPPVESPTSHRLQEKLAEHDVRGERAIAVAQGAIALFVLILHLVAQLGKGTGFGNSAVMLTLCALLGSSMLRLLLVRGARLPERTLDLMNILDIAIFLALIWSYQFAYGHPAGGGLKAPSAALLFVLVGLRALRFHPRPILVAGGTAVAGWVLLVLLAMRQDGDGAITHSYPDYLVSYRILIGAEVEKLVALAALALLLAFATHVARNLLSRAAHASDYAEALAAARTHLDEATRARQRAESALQEVARRDSELCRQNELLRRHEDELRRRNSQLDAVFENMLQGIAMFDEDQRLVMCNRLYAEMYGLSLDQIKPGTTVRQIFELRIANGQYHVKDTEEFVGSWAGGFGAKSTRIQELADGRIIRVARAKTGDGGRVVTHDDITERQALNRRIEQQNQLMQAQQDQLRAQNLRLDAALNNMVQGLAMFDAELRLVICNRLYAEIYDLPRELAQPGTSLRQILEHGIAAGTVRGRSVDEVMNSLIARVAGNRAAHYTTVLPDGRCIAVDMQPMTDGGTVTTHQDITEQRRYEAKIAHMAMHDALTGLPNRVLLNERLEQALASVKAGEKFAVHLLDLDQFKNVNDTLGHPAGDKLLKMVADRLRVAVRESDTIARMGGDEFAIVQADVDDLADATFLARRVIELVSEPYDIDGTQVVIGTSVGIAVGPADAAGPDQLMRNADLALYMAKADGRGTSRFFEPEMDARVQAQRALEYDLRKAVACGQFELHYQPVVNLESGQINAFEALIRWHHPKRGTISPGLFIPAAEETGLILPIGEWAIRQACADAAKWPDGMKVAVNLSPAQFRGPGLIQTVISALAGSGLSADRLELEITETVLLQDSETTLATLHKLRQLGVSIAMDDFGTGYSSLRYLQSFPFDRIKIDRSFITNVADASGSLNIVRAVVALARGLGMMTTAEGVETEEQLAALKLEGCSEMQGFLFGRPLPASEIAQAFFGRSMPAGSERRVSAA